MRESKQIYEKVAEKCSSYTKTTQTGLSNCVDCNCTSCLNCDHFTPDEHCVLDLFDSIKENL